ncbi:MAG: hypothetical protein ACOKSU_26150 [Pseudomonas sp.]|uniref:hypothetical protein n=1 Tax=Pseudomonas TaxID=286 RepID=UPI0003C09C7C|nr:hypothetical protein [Pseudomonas sp. VLB120]AGZ34689.1 hypothetical protein PVLB_09455 [Pseudomonas sp. VLB120]
MDTNKMRAEFEEAFVEEEVRLLGEGFRSSALYMIEKNTVNVRSAWWAWQASREAVVVELPKFDDYPASMERDMRESLRSAVEAQGLKVSP